MSRAAGELGPASRLSGSSQLQLPLGTQIAPSALTPNEAPPQTDEVYQLARVV
jgi:hypothetical protein